MILDKSKLESLAQKLATYVKDDKTVVALNGDMGTGKTFFTSLFLKNMGVEDRVVSPTYSFVKEYFVKDRQIIHIDAYKLSEKDLESIGFYNYLESAHLLVVEWANNIVNKMPKEYIKIDFDYLTSDNIDLDNSAKREVSLYKIVGDKSVHINF